MQVITYEWQISTGENTCNIESIEDNLENKILYIMKTQKNKNQI